MPVRINSAIVRKAGTQPAIDDRSHLMALADAQVLIHIAASGICHTGLQAAKRVSPVKSLAAHGYAGLVEADISADVERVALIPLDCPSAAGEIAVNGLKTIDAKPGDWVAILGAGGTGFLALQYAKAMGLHVAVIDVSDDRLELARIEGADVTINAMTDPDTASTVTIATGGGGAQGVLITGPALAAFRQGVSMTRREGTCVLLGLPAGDFLAPLFDVVLKRITIRGSLSDTRRDIREALQFAAEGRVETDVSRLPIERINAVFELLREGHVEGRVVLDIADRIENPAGRTAPVNSTAIDQNLTDDDRFTAEPCGKKIT